MAQSVRPLCHSSGRTMFRSALILLLLLLCLPSLADTTTASEPRTGLVLSGGGARGLAHIGVLKQIEKMDIQIHAIAGTSMGAVIGGLYAAGYSAEELERIALEMDWPAALSDSPQREDIPYRRKQDDRDFLVKQRLSFKDGRSEEHTSELQSRPHLVCRLLLEKKK